jgi:hypothetical protein
MRPSEPSWIRSRNVRPRPEVALGDRHDEAQVRLDHLLLGLHVPALDALGERDLLLCGEQRHAADRPQVEPQGVQRRLDREVDRRLLGLVDLLLLAARLGGGLELGTLVRDGLAVRGDDVDALLLQVGVQLADLLLRDVDLLQCGGDLLDREDALVLSLGDQRPQLVHLGDGCLVGQQCFALLTQARPSLVVQVQIPAAPTAGVPLPLVLHLGAAARRASRLRHGSSRSYRRGWQPVGGVIAQSYAHTRNP